MPSFTTVLPNLEADGPVVEVNFAVSAVLEQQLQARSEPVPAPVRAVALIDTGASGTVLQQGLPQQLGLHPVGSVLISTPSSTNVRCAQYAVRMVLPNNLVVDGITAIEAPLQGQNIQALIGRDVLAHGVLTYIGYIGQFTLSF